MHEHRTVAPGPMAMGVAARDHGRGLGGGDGVEEVGRASAGHARRRVRRDRRRHQLMVQRRRGPAGRRSETAASTTCVGRRRRSRPAWLCGAGVDGDDPQAGARRGHGTDTLESSTRRRPCGPAADGSRWRWLPPSWLPGRTMRDGRQADRQQLAGQVVLARPVVVGDVALDDQQLGAPGQQLGDRGGAVHTTGWATAGSRSDDTGAACRTASRRGGGRRSSPPGPAAGPAGGVSVVDVSDAAPSRWIGIVVAGLRPSSHGAGAAVGLDLDRAGRRRRPWRPAAARASRAARPSARRRRRQHGGGSAPKTVSTPASSRGEARWRSATLTRWRSRICSHALGRLRHRVLGQEARPRRPASSGRVSRVTGSTMRTIEVGREARVGLVPVLAHEAPRQRARGRGGRCSGRGGSARPACCTSSVKAKSKVRSHQRGGRGTRPARTARDAGPADCGRRGSRARQPS